MTETARKNIGEIAPLGRLEWSRPKQMADRYLLAVGITLPDVREALIEAAAERLELEQRSAAPHVRGVRMLACVERVLCERVGAQPGSDTTDSDTARRRLLFAVDPSLEVQRALLVEPGPAPAARADCGFTPVPQVRRRKRMPRQNISFRHPPFWGTRLGKDAAR